MISENSRKRINNTVISEIKFEHIIIKALHDFFEEQEFLFLLPKSISNLTSNLTHKSDEKFLLDLINTKFKKPQHAVTSHQILLGGLGLDNFYTIHQEENENKEIITKIYLETSEMDFDDLTLLIERLMRRVSVDLVSKSNMNIKKEGSNLQWKHTFPVMSRHDIELEFGDGWRNETVKEYKSPFYISCIEPEFFDKMDEEKSGKHYLNFEFYLPNCPRAVIKGGQREHRYQEMMNQMGELGINRYDYSNYLLYLSENKLRSSSGLVIYVDDLVNAFQTLLNMKVYN